MSVFADLLLRRNRPTSRCVSLGRPFAAGPGARGSRDAQHSFGPERSSGLPVRRYGREDLAAFLFEAFEVVEGFEFDHVTAQQNIQRFHVGRLQKRSAST